MERTIIQQEASLLIKTLIGQGEILKKIKHPGLNGQLKELLVSGILKPFLTAQFGIGSGIVINRDKQQSEQADIIKQSKQTDIIIYDNRILPPFF